MPRFQCPHCLKQIKGSARFVGTERNCPGCGERFVVESVDTQPTSEDAGFGGTSSDGSDDNLRPALDIKSGDCSDIRSGQQLKSIAVSLALHAVLLVVAALIVIPLSAARRPEIITVLPANPEVSQLEVAEIETLKPIEELPAKFVPPSTAQIQEISTPEISSVISLPGNPPSPAGAMKTAGADVAEQVPGTDRSGSSVRSDTPTKATVQQASSIGDAVDPIIRSIKSRIEKNDTLVVWLMDRSISMQQQRAALAERLKDFIETVAKERTDESYELTHAVVAFGARPEKVTITKKPDVVLDAIRKQYATDRSGKENIFAAIEWCELQYLKKTRSFQDNSVLFVVCTDESGDDYLRLERTIAKCRESNIEVSVIGPSAVLGQMQGYHAYVASDNKTYYLKVARGPETALPQRLQLRYWFRDVPPDWDESRRGPWNGQLPIWQGGSNFDSMLSGFSPYALTRLTMMTGGSYVLFDREGDRSPFSIDELAAYMPDYRSADVISKELQEDPLRMAVIKAVQGTYELRLREPRTEFGMPFGSIFYVFPGDFQATISAKLALEQQLAIDAARSIDRLLVLFEGRTVDGLYRQEESARWRAWYDLTYGRLLAARVRYGVYSDFLTQLTKNRLGPETNGLSIQSVNISSAVETGPHLKEAIRLLERCVESNPNTPWEILAERELANGFGLRVKEHAVPLPTNFGPPPKDQPVPLPNL